MHDLDGDGRRGDGDSDFDGNDRDESDDESTETTGDDSDSQDFSIRSKLGNEEGRSRAISPTSREGEVSAFLVTLFPSLLGRVEDDEESNNDNDAAADEDDTIDSRSETSTISVKLAVG